MRITSDDRENIIWSWGKREEEELVTRFKTNLVSCLNKVTDTINGKKGLTGQELGELVTDLENAGKLLDECASNVMALGATIRAMTNTRTGLPSGSAMGHLEQSIGKKVLLTRTTIDELNGQHVYLEGMDESNVIIRSGDDYWETPIDRVLVVEPDEMPGKKISPAKSANKSVSRKALELFRNLKNNSSQQPVVIVPNPKQLSITINYNDNSEPEEIAYSALPKNILGLCPEPEVDIFSAQKGESSKAGKMLLADSHAFLKLSSGEIGSAIQFLTMTGKTGKLELEVVNSGIVSKANVYIADGNVVHAAYKKEEGLEAFSYIMCADKIEAHFLKNKKTAKKSISLPTDQLLIEAAVRSDEIKGKKSQQAV